MTSTVTLQPQHTLAEGRYLLDGEGRLHPMRYRRFIVAVAIVKITAKTEAARERAKAAEGRAEEVRKPAPKINPANVWAAYKRKAVGREQKAAKAPTKHAESGEACPRCGIPGRRGCAHFLPYEPGK